MYDVIIIGAGTAGLSASIYAVRSGKSVLVLEAKCYGGQIVNAVKIENYPGIKEVSGYKFASDLYRQAIDLGVEYKSGQAVKIINIYFDKEKKFPAKKVIMADGKSYESISVIIATGADKKMLGIAGEDRLIGKGLSYCATCDGAFYKEKDVAVVGGGNTALEDAVFLSGYCNKVYLIHRRDEFRGEKRLVMKLKAMKNVEFILKSTVTQLNTDESGMLESAEVLQSDEQGCSRKKLINISGIFVAIGQKPANENFADIVVLDDYGYICAKENCITDTDGVFAAGDCRTKKVRQLTTAASDGAVAGLAAAEYATEFESYHTKHTNLVD